jgi:hypothetical protein
MFVPRYNQGFGESTECGTRVESLRSNTPEAYWCKSAARRPYLIGASPRRRRERL